MTAKTPKLGAAWVTNLYHYDQLNRITSAQTYNGTRLAQYYQNYSYAYNEYFFYDGNGNLTFNKRTNENAAAPVNMDDLQYQYNRDGAGKLINNQLKQVYDGAADNAAYPNELKNGYTNYTYDAIGNITKEAQQTTGRQTNYDWTVYGKLKSVTGITPAVNITYAYNAAGQRMQSNTTSNIKTWYVRDAQGNPLAVYNNAHGVTNWVEQHLYGSARLGVWTPNMVVTSGASSEMQWDTLGKKQFELTNHLGNVLATISDRRIQFANSGNTAVLYYDADVITAQDYYAFGDLRPGRSFNNNSTLYRYGFNGKENDNEVKGTGNEQDYGMRVYDPRVGRFLSVDPLTESYPHYSPYQFAGNTPILAKDIDGEEPIRSNLIPDSYPATLQNIAEDQIFAYLLLSWKASARNFTRNVQGNVRAGLGSTINRNEFGLWQLLLEMYICIKNLLKKEEVHLY